MKKILALILALVLTAVSLSALATPVDPRDNEINHAETDANPEAALALVIAEGDGEGYDWVLQERVRLLDAESPEEYFGQVEELKKIFGDTPLNVNEFWPITAENYDESMGDVTAKIAFSTPYVPETPIVIEIGLSAEDEAGNPAMEWHLFQGKVLEDSRVKVTFDAETMAAIQEKGALIAAVNAPIWPSSGKINPEKKDPDVPPSKQDSDLNKAETDVDPEHGLGISFGLEVKLVNRTNREIERLMAAESVESYFDQEKPIHLLLDAPEAAEEAEAPAEEAEEEEIKVNEMWPITAKNYDIRMGSVLTKFTFATPYEAEKKVAVMVGFQVGVDEDGQDIMQWCTYQGVGTEDGAVLVTLDPATLIRIEEEGGLIAIVSK